MDLSKEIDLILSEGYGAGIDKAILNLTKEVTQVQRKIHLMKMIKFSEFFQDCLLNSGIKEEDIQMLHFKSGWESAEDMGGHNGNQFWVFDIEFKEDKPAKHNVINRLCSEIDSEIAGLGKINPRFLPKDSTDSFATSFSIKPIFANQKDSFLANTLNKEDLFEYSAQFLDSSLKSNILIKPITKKV